MKPNLDDLIQKRQSLLTQMQSIDRLRRGSLSKQFFQSRSPGQTTWMNAGTVSITPVISKSNSPPEIRLLCGHTHTHRGGVRIYSPATRAFAIFGGMKSMTGYGRGDCSQDGFKITVELSSVNRKQSEIAINLPREMETLEAPIRDAINRHIARGRLTVRVTLHAGTGNLSARQHLNVPLAKAYARELAKLAKELKLAGPVTLDQLVRAPGVFQTDAEIAEAENFWPAVEKALTKALATLVKMREREGEHLAKDLAERIGIMRRSVKTVQANAPQVAARYREQLLVRIKSAGLEAPMADDERLLKEVVYFADRSDITEELTRLQSHFQQFDDSLKTKEPVGRTLDFLAQEMNREINTLGSKANDSIISREVVTLKTELEKFREQAMNVE